MLVAVAVLMILMAGFTMLFTGSVRTVRSAMQQNDAYDQATGALSSIKLDLMAGFNAESTGNTFSFYGTPIGMTFVGNVKNLSDFVSTDPGVADYHLARVTYVLYHDPGSQPQFFEDGFYDEATGTTQGAFTHRVLRYVEPNALDLDTFPVDWQNAPADGEGVTLQYLLDEEWDVFQQLHFPPGTAQATIDAAFEPFMRAKKCEFWIRMLAGGDDWLDGRAGYGVPNAWQAPGDCLGRPDLQDRVLAGENVVADYVLTDAVATTVPPFSFETYPVPGYTSFPFSGPAIFDYDYARPGLYGQKPPNGWWNDPRSINCQNGYTFCADTCLPEIVSASFFLMFEAPYVSAPNFQKLFHMQINLPTAYIRQGIISGFVYDANGAVAAAVIEEIPDTGNEIKTDASGYYSVSVPYGWTGTIQVAGPLTDPPIREFTNVTTHIENQNYDVQ